MSEKICSYCGERHHPNYKRKQCSRCDSELAAPTGLDGLGQTIKDFVVILGGEPYRFRVIGEDHWVNRLTAAKQWVTVRRSSGAEVDILWEYRLKSEQAKLYEMGLPYLAA